MLHLCRKLFRMKKPIFFLFQFLLFNGIFAQQKELIIQKESKGFYVEHKTAAKENFYSIGRLYNIHPRNLANYNNLVMARGLSLTQQIKVPLSDTNFSQTVSQGVPIYYSILAKEDLNKVAAKFNLTKEKLNEWNKNSSMKISTGMKFIIGFLVTNEMKDRVMKFSSTDDFKNPTEKVEQEIIPQPPIQEVKKQTENNVASLQSENGSINYFEKSFAQQIKLSPITKEQTVTAGIFKTVTGWQDGKYYLLINDVEPGTILKITNPTNNKIIYAKVLYSMEGIRQNQGLDIRISNAAAAVLEVAETDKFVLLVSY